MSLRPENLVLTIIESPFAAPTPEGVKENERYARECMCDSLKRGEAPYASHLLYTQPGVLNDRDPEERALGMVAGFAFGLVAKRAAIYTDRGISSGMRAGITRHRANGLEVVERSLIGSAELATPAEMARMLATIGRVVAPSALVDANPGVSEVRDAMAFIRAERSFANGLSLTGEKPTPPEWLAKLFSA